MTRMAGKCHNHRLQTNPRETEHSQPQTADIERERHRTQPQTADYPLTWKGRDISQPQHNGKKATSSLFLRKMIVMLET